MVVSSISDPAQSLIFEHFHPRIDEQVLILEGGDGELARNVASLVPEGKVLSLDRDIRNIWKAETTLSRIPNAATGHSVLPTSHGWKSILIIIPKERRFSRALLVASWKALEPHGQLYLAGPTRRGAKAVIKDAQRIFRNVTNIGYRNHQRVASCRKDSELPNPLPQEFQQIGIAPDTIRTIEVKRPEKTITLETHPGIFSWEAIDDGTSFLIDNLKILPGSTIWDVGCGYGIIGLCAAVTGAGFVCMSDINLLSVNISLKNTVQNQLSEIVSIFPGDGLYIPQDLNVPSSFDLIVSNPAFHQGHSVDKSMADTLILCAKDRLTKDGRLLIVANRFLNYDKNMRNEFAKVTKIAENSKYHILEGIK
jgi:16S rRNA G1207 methylase RsmC